MLKEEIIKLRQEGYSYSEISKKVGKSKKFVYKIAKNINFNERGSIRYHKEVKGIIKRIKPQDKNLSLRKTRILSHIMFDGTIYKSNAYHSVIRYINSSKELIEQFAKDVLEVYGLKPSAFEEIKGKHLPIYKVGFYSKEMFNDVLKFSPSYSTSKEETEIPAEIVNGDTNLRIEFLKAFWEDEGSISSTGRIMGDLKSKKVINQLIKLHEELELKFKLTKYLDKNGFIYKIYLPKSQENLEKFHNMGLFDKSIITHGKNLGRRKVDVLKEHIEKLKNT